MMTTSTFRAGPPVRPAHKNAFVFTVCACATLASAQTSQPAEPRMASKEEYAACLDSEDELDRSHAGLTRKQDDLKQLSAKFKAADDRFNAQVRQHAPSSKAEIESYNRAIDKRNQHVEEFNERSRALQREQNRLNAKVLEHNAKCGFLLIPTEVKDQVMQERKARGDKR